jgi:aspartyl-tRNA(Asn)/glutamyl-tRNA(Gln) amidotransferase subunit C
MKDIDKNILENLTLQCKIELPEEEKEGFLNDLARILEYSHLLDQVDTEHVEPCYHVLPEMQNVFRKDEVIETMTKEELLQNASDHIGGMIKVPKLFQEE